jgi:hypothetical protein
MIYRKFVRFKNNILKYKIIDYTKSYFVRDVEVGFSRKISKGNIVDVLHILEKSLYLFEEVFPVKYTDFLHDVNKIYVIENTKSIIDGNNITAFFINDLKSIVFPVGVFFDNSGFTNIIRFVGSLILHESQHARLHRLNFGSKREMLGRQERICYAVQKRFGEKIQDIEIVDYCDYALSVNLENHYSSESFIDRQLSDVVNQEIPKWLKKYFVKKVIKEYMHQFDVKTHDHLPETIKKWCFYFEKR